MLVYTFLTFFQYLPDQVSQPYDNLVTTGETESSCYTKEKVDERTKNSV